MNFGAICLAVYRPDPRSLTCQLRSILTQTHGDFVCLLAVDGAGSAPVALLRDILGSDDRLRLVGFDDHVGHYRNFERLLHLVPADAAWVALADQDDRWDPNKLEVLLPHLERFPLVTGQARIRKGLDGPVLGVTRRRQVELASLIVENQVTGSFSIMRRELLEHALPFPPPTSVSFHDHWLGVCAQAHGGYWIHDATLQDYVQHDSNVVGETAPSLRTAIGRLTKAVLDEGSWSHPLSPALTRLVDDRYRWRATMAARVLSTGHHSVSDERALHAIVEGDPVRLLIPALRGAARGEVPMYRAASHVASSFGWALAARVKQRH